MTVVKSLMAGHFRSDCWAACGAPGDSARQLEVFYGHSEASQTCFDPQGGRKKYPKNAPGRD